MKITTTLLASLLFAGVAHADVTLTIPDDVELLVVNQAKPEIEGGLFSASNTVSLPDGENQIVLRYKPYFNQGNDRIIIESNAVIATFSTQDQQIEFQLPQYRNQRTAEKQIGQFEVLIVDQQGQPVTITQDELTKKGLQIGRDYIRETLDYNASGAIAAIALGSADHDQPLPTNQTKSAANSAEEMLHFWYQKADGKTKEKFKQFVNQL